jgi:hypothetical protein
MAAHLLPSSGDNVIRSAFVSLAAVAALAVALVGTAFIDFAKRTYGAAFNFTIRLGAPLARMPARRRATDRRSRPAGACA